MDHPYHHPEIKTHNVNTENARLLIFEIFSILISGQNLIGDGSEVVDDDKIDNKLWSPIDFEQQK